MLPDVVQATAAARARFGQQIRFGQQMGKEINMRRKFIAGNWKMYTTAATAERLAQAVVDGLGDEARVSIAICPPFPYLDLVGKILKGSPIALGAQNLFPEKEGAFTGEVSPTMLLDLGCKYVILGHSERRHTLGESDAFINKKVRVALAAGLDVILCVGETLGEQESGRTKAVLDRQLTQGLADVSADSLARLSIAYEPVWAIGSTGHHATPQQAQESHSVIRHRFGRMFGERSAEAVVIQYGGSVKPENAAGLLRQPDVDGALIGGASLNAEQFLAIVQAGIDQPQTKGGPV
jgi:triosephosphate isomerase